MGTQKQKTHEYVEETKTDVTNGENNSGDSATKYVVVRGGVRVSDKEYLTSDNTECKDEFEFWKRVSDNHSHGEPVEIVEYDSKKHRVW